MNKIGRYQIRETVRRDDMATIYHAYDPLFERDVAIKVIKAAFLGDESFHQRVEREAKVIISLEHPAIVPVYDFRVENGLCYVVMHRQLTLSESLADRLQQGRLTIREAGQLLERIAPALDLAHAQGLVHGDLKPAKILFDLQGKPYLTDFGLATVQSRVSLSQSGMLMISTTYLSPEQAGADKQIDGRSDIYALGVILFEMLTGEVPYEDYDSLGLAYKQIYNPIPSACALNAELPASCDRVIARAMAKDREERYATVSELSAAWKAMIDAQPGPMRPSVPRKQPPSPIPIDVQAESIIIDSESTQVDTVPTPVYIQIWPIMATIALVFVVISLLLVNSDHIMNIMARAYIP